MDSAVFTYATRANTPDLMYMDTCTNGSIDFTYQLISDERGSVRSVINVATGAVVEQYLYDAWGKLRAFDLVPSGGALDPVVRYQPTIQPFGFAGGIWDQQALVWRFGARDYDPDIGRWTTRDPIGFDGGYNLYAYCDNDPINRIDVSGLDAWESFGDAVIWVAESSGGQFAVGFGDSLSLGLTRAWRVATDTDGGVNTCGSAYQAGEWTEVALEVGLTGGGALLRRGAVGLSRSAIRASARGAMSAVRRPGTAVHHIHALFGHPGAARGLFPMASLPSWIHSGRWNLVVLDRVAHTMAHRNAVVAERLLESTMMRPGLTAGRALRDAVW